MKAKVLCSLLAVMSFLLYLASCSAGAALGMYNPDYYVEGYVYDETGKPIEGIVVSIGCMNHGVFESYVAALSDKNGWYKTEVTNEETDEDCIITYDPYDEYVNDTIYDIECDFTDKNGKYHDGLFRIEQDFYLKKVSNK